MRCGRFAIRWLMFLAVSVIALAAAPLAAQFSIPLPTNAHIPDVRSLFSPDDVPQYLIDKGEVDLTVDTRTTVRPDGTIEGCVAEHSSGDPKLDAYTCALIVRRAKFLPARWADGTAAYGVIRAPVRWQVTSNPGSGAGRSTSEVPDLELSVNQLPKGAPSVVPLMLQIEADDKGHPLSCAEWAPLADDHSKHFPELVPIACQQATASLTLFPPLDASGKAVRSVQTVSADFKLGQ